MTARYPLVPVPCKHCPATRRLGAVHHQPHEHRTRVEQARNAGQQDDRRPDLAGQAQRADVAGEVLAHLVHAGAAAQLFHGLEEVDDLLGERRLGDAAASSAEHLDLALER